MNENYKKALDKILDKAKFKIELVESKETLYLGTKEITLVSSKNGSKVYLFKDGKENVFDRFFIQLKENENMDECTMSCLIINLIMREKLFNVGAMNKEGSIETTFKIPSFSSVDELHILMDMVI